MRASTLFLVGVCCFIFFAAASGHECHHDVEVAVDYVTCSEMLSMPLNDETDRVAIYFKTPVSDDDHDDLYQLTDVTFTLSASSNANVRYELWSGVTTGVPKPKDKITELGTAAVTLSTATQVTIEVSDSEDVHLNPNTGYWIVAANVWTPEVSITVYYANYPTSSEPCYNGFNAWSAAKGSDDWSMYEEDPFLAKVTVCPIGSHSSASRLSSAFSLQ